MLDRGALAFGGSVSFSLQKKPGKFLVPHFGGNLPRETNPAVVVDEDYVARRRLFPAATRSLSGDGAPYDEVRVVGLSERRKRRKKPA